MASKVTEDDIVYIAAVIDTQGHITTRTVRDATLPLVAVSGKNDELLRWLGRMTGVRPFITTRDYSRHACNIHCPSAHQRIVSFSGRWSLSGIKATILLQGILPYMRFQRVAAIDAIQVGLEAGYKPATIEKMKALGWQPPER